MRKNKKVTYLLIALVGLIWGLFFFKIYSNFGKNRLAKKITSQPSATVENVPMDSSYTLLLDYPDPFLKGLEQSVNTVRSAPKFQVINWPPVEYRGLLAGNSKKDNTGLLKVQNSNFLVKSGNDYSGVKVMKISKDSIFLKYQDEKRWIKLAK